MLGIFILKAPIDHFLFLDLILCAKRKKIPGPKDIRATAIPVAIPSSVIGGAQHSSLWREMMWLGIATSISNRLPRNNQRVMQEVNALGSSEV